MVKMTTCTLMGFSLKYLQNKTIKHFFIFNEYFFHFVFVSVGQADLGKDDRGDTNLFGMYLLQVLNYSQMCLYKRPSLLCSQSCFWTSAKKKN
jgi:hypothetical protein